MAIKRGAGEPESERDFLVGEKMIEAKGKRSERNGCLGEKLNIYCALLIVMVFLLTLYRLFSL